MTNIEFLNNMGFDLDASTNFLANQLANKFLDTENMEPIRVHVDNATVVLKPNAFAMAYMERIWKELDPKQKLRVLHWTKNTFCQKHNIPNQPFMFFDYYEKNLEHCPAYTLGDKIFLNLEEFVLHSTGYECFEFLTHECIHVLQCNYYGTVPDSLHDFLFKNSDEKYVKNLDIISLSLDGKNFNYRTNQFEYLSQRASRDLLFLENNIVVIQPTNTNIWCKKASVKSYKDFENLVTNLLYYSSPFEYEAYITSKKITQKLVERNTKLYQNLACESDFKTIDGLRISKAKIDARRHTLQRYFKMNANQIFDMQAKYLFYNKTYASALSHSKTMLEHKAKFDKVFKAKFETKFNSGLKEFLNNTSQTTINDHKTL